MPPREWTDDEVKAEIREAVRIAKEDGVYKRITALESRLSGGNSDPANPTGKKPGEGDPPPKGDPKNSAENPPRRGGWWPVREEPTTNAS